MYGQFNLNRTFTIGGLIGRTVVFLADEVAPVSKYQDAVELQPAKGKLPAAWLSNADIITARAFAKGEASAILDSFATGPVEPDAPKDSAKQISGKRGLLGFLSRKPKDGEPPKAVDTGAAVYGFWSTALYNNAVDLDRPLTVAPFDEDSGLYLLTDNGVVYDSGLYVGGHVPGAAVDLDEAARLDVSDAAIRKWKAPPHPALSIAEKVKLRKRDNDLRLIRLMAALGLNIVGAFLLYQVLDSSAISRINRQAQAAQQTSMIESALPAMKINKLASEKYPDTESLVALMAVQQLFYATRGLSVSWEDFSSPDLKEFTAIASQPMLELTFPHKRVPRSDGTYFYSFPRANSPAPSVAAAPAATP